MAVVVLTTALVRGGWGEPSAAPAPDPSSSTARIASIHTGPQGTVPQFVVKCAFSHTAPNDPIVHPGMTGMSHSHDFFGNRLTDADSTAASLLGGPTTCNKQSDTAAYWAPTLFDHGQPVTPWGWWRTTGPLPGSTRRRCSPTPPG